MLHGGVIVLLRRRNLQLAQGNGRQLVGIGGAETAPQQLLDRVIRLLHRTRQRHGKRIEQHCKAGYPGNCKALTGHGGQSVGLSDQVGI